MDAEKGNLGKFCDYLKKKLGKEGGKGGVETIVADDAGPNLLGLLPEVLCHIFLFLDVRDIAVVELVCRRLRDVVVANKVDKITLGHIFRRKKVKNFMFFLDEDDAGRGLSPEDDSKYYKNRLYWYLLPGVRDEYVKKSGEDAARKKEIRKIVRGCNKMKFAPWI